MSYTNGCTSGYIGCHIFESAGIPVQKTLLGTYTKNGKEKIVVACKDSDVSFEKLRERDWNSNSEQYTAARI